jgi:hypothetical protein
MAPVPAISDRSYRRGPAFAVQRPSTLASRPQLALDQKCLVLSVTCKLSSIRSSATANRAQKNESEKQIDHQRAQGTAAKYLVDGDLEEQRRDQGEDLEKEGGCEDLNKQMGSYGLHPKTS